MALSVVLLVGASLFTRSLWAVTSIDPGFETSHLLTAGIWAMLPGPTGRRVQMSNLPNQAPVTDPLVSQQDIVDRLAEVPGVVGVAVVQGGAPLNRSMFRSSVEVDGRNLRSAPIDIRRVSDGYHAVLRVPLVDGRYFDLTDRINRLPVAIVNRRAATLMFDAERAVGRTFRVQGAEHRIVGVVDDVRQQSLEDEPVAQVNVPWWSPIRGLRSASGTLVIRSREDPRTLVPITRRAVADVYPDVPVRSIQTMDETVARLTAERRFNMVLLGAFGVLGLLIATIGVYGTLAYSVAQRTREIGVRMALGATARRVVGLVVSEVGRLVVVGVGLGTVGAWWLSTVVKSYLYGIDARDATSFAAATLVMTLAAALATVVPARRATAVQPATALRAE